MHFNAIWACLALCLVSVVHAGPLPKAGAGPTTLARPGSSSVPHARRNGGDEYVATFTFTRASGRGAARAKVATPRDIDRVKALIIRAAKKKWQKNVDRSEIRIVGNQYTSSTNAVPFTLNAPGLEECNPLPCEGEALYHVFNANNKPELGAGKIFSQSPNKIIYDSNNEMWKNPQLVDSSKSVA
ncbi:hypothetical protein F5876DRAFT_69407 [Lentinula aff. lateritia]|uniref:Uncharacterized protein n=1 Tax=Lentinula aff. lateritia TaxID=2804960 RepID=A0ACC1TNF1_9AGAR|nr:hypothetical protein F5876DRAFT_69407 [Lentinula aff. lateritia]